MNKKKAFVGQIYPVKMCDRLSHCSVAGNDYQIKFIKYINIEYIINIPMISDKKYEKLNFKPLENKIYYFFSMMKISLREFLKYREAEVVYHYNISIHNVFLFILYKFSGKVQILILADKTWRDKSLLKFIYLQIISNMSGVISLAGHTDGLNRNLLALPGFVNNEKSYLKSAPINKKDIVFSGSLNKYTGVELLCKLAPIMRDFNFHVYGRGALSDSVLELERNFDNVFFHGFVSSAVYAKDILNYDIALNLRNPNLEENKWNFPSKILEYSFFNIFTISTMKYDFLPSSIGIYAEYSPHSVKKAIESILLLDDKLIYSRKALLFDSYSREFSFDKIATSVQSFEDACSS